MEELPQFTEARKAPVALLSDESMVGIYEKARQKSVVITMRKRHASGCVTRVRKKGEDVRETVKIVGSEGLEMTSANCAQACHPSGARLGSAYSR